MRLLERDAQLAALAVAALAGSRVEPDLLERAGGSTPAAVDELVDRGLLVSEGDRLCFRHEISRLTVDQAVPAHRRPGIHRAIIDALLAGGCDDDARLAFHAEGAGDGALALSHASVAARRASELSAHREAVAQYERALRFADGTDTRAKATLFDALAQECSLVDRWQQSADARQAALELWRQEGDRLREGDSLRCLARAMWRLCRGTEDQAASRAAMEVLEPLGPTPELARTYITESGMLLTFGKPKAALEVADRAMALAEQLDLTDVTADALNMRGCTMAIVGQDRWWEPLDSAIAVATEAGPDHATEDADRSGGRGHRTARRHHRCRRSPSGRLGR